MPAITTCPICGFNGPHGFTQNIPFTVTYFHGKHRFYSIGGEYETDYEKVIRKVHRTDTRFHSLWVAFMLDSNPRRKHVQVYKRANQGWCTSVDRLWIEKHYPYEAKKILERSQLRV